MLEIGKNIVQGVWNGISGAAGWFADQVSGFFGGIVDKAKGALGIHSPSRVMAAQVGKWIPPGIGQGIKDSMPDLHSEMDEEMFSLTNKMKATVALETKKSSTSIGATNSFNIPSMNNETDEKESVFIVKNYVDSKEISEYTYKKVNGQFAMASKRMR